MEEERERKETEPVRLALRVCSRGHLSLPLVDRCPYCGEKFEDEKSLIRLLFED